MMEAEKKKKRQLMKREEAKEGRGGGQGDFKGRDPVWGPRGEMEGMEH